MKTKIIGPSPRKRIYLVAPKSPPNFWNMQATVDAVGAKALMPNSALATLVALTPQDIGVEYVYCDENLSDLQPDLDCDLVALTGYTLHAPRMREIAKLFRERGIPVAIGGALATLDPEQVRPYADHFFKGEAELTWPTFLREFSRGEASSVYEQSEFVDLASSPPPDWSLIDGSDYLYFTVQTSRGCPNRCDFCDAIRIVGRKHRHKSIEKVMVEVRNAHAAGAETVFFSDDNFYVRKRHTRELLDEIVKWNTELTSPLSFSCQASVTIADEDELLRRLADARMSVVFLGVESLRKACLDEVNKGHLYRENLSERIKAMSSYGIIPFIGLIVGFDNDDVKTFDEIENFLDETGSPIASITVLCAPKHTVLHHRLSEAGRIREDFKGEWHDATNIVPISMETSELSLRYRNLFRRLYEPDRFEARASDWLHNVSYHSDCYRNRRMRASKLWKAAYAAKHYLFKSPAPVRQLFLHLIREGWRTDKRLLRKSITILTQYCHYASYVHEW